MCAFKPQALLTVALLIGCAFSQEQPSVVSFGDFMEFDLSLHRACENATGGQNTTVAIINSFAQCTFNLSPTRPKDNFEGMEVICKNRAKYLDCWDKLKADTLNRCGRDKEMYLPVVYRATAASLCGNDNGARTIESLKQAISEVRPDDERSCSEETGIHWIENCKAFLDTMNSSDMCARHGAIDKCLQKITCDNIKFAKLLRQVYSDGRPHLQCNERRA